MVNESPVPLRLLLGRSHKMSIQLTHNGVATPTPELRSSRPVYQPVTLQGLVARTVHSSIRVGVVASNPGPTTTTTTTTTTAAAMCLMTVLVAKADSGYEYLQ